MNRTRSELMNINTFYSLSKEKQKIITERICTLAKGHVDTGYSIAVVCRRTYIDAKRYSVGLVDAIIRSSYVVECYNEKNPESRPVQRIDFANRLLKYRNENKTIQNNSFI